MHRVTPESCGVTICNVRPKKGNPHLSWQQRGGFGDHITSNVEKVLPPLRQLRGNLQHVFFFTPNVL